MLRPVKWHPWTDRVEQFQRGQREAGEIVRRISSDALELVWAAVRAAFVTGVVIGALIGGMLVWLMTK